MSNKKRITRTDEKSFSVTNPKNGYRFIKSFHQQEAPTELEQLDSLVKAIEKKQNEENSIRMMAINARENLKKPTKFKDIPK